MPSLGRIVCVGDAAHAMEPNLGQGACQALEDAAALAAIALDSEPDVIARKFEEQRLKRVRRIVGQAAEARGGAHGPVFMQLAMRTILRTLPGKFVDGISRGVQTMPDYR
jgi:2-polyprenyl-6-methoxyphenol hydroxylase-like FAD-dependent oxidoreductase